MKKRPFISVIVPVYNTGVFLAQCANSVTSQTMQDFEIILINDGSTDSSGQVCDSLAMADSRIKAIHQNNGGVADARNTGIKHSNGEWLMFLDSDDYWDSNLALELVSRELINQRVDVLLYRAKHLQYDGSIDRIDKLSLMANLENMDPVQQLQYLVRSAFLTSAAWNKITRRSLIIENNLYFKNFRVSEDIEWVVRLSNCLPVYGYLEETFYVYRRSRPRQITSVMDLQALK